MHAVLLMEDDRYGVLDPVKIVPKQVIWDTYSNRYKVKSDSLLEAGEELVSVLVVEPI